MSDRPKQNIPASVHQRLLNLARERKEDFNLLLSRYGAERMLYRLSVSKWREHFVLKGAFLIQIWNQVPYRPTRDIDLLAYGLPEFDRIVEIFRGISAITLESDGIIFLPETVSALSIKETALYPGIRVALRGLLGSTRISVQIDIGFGDIVTPSTEEITVPSLLNMPAAQLLSYPVYTVIAEKYHAIAVLGISNSRMKDYFDLYMLVRSEHLNRILLEDAITATFKRRRTSLPISPVGLTSEFADDPNKQHQWAAFLRKNKLELIELADVIQLLATILSPLRPPE